MKTDYILTCKFEEHFITRADAFLAMQSLANKLDKEYVACINSIALCLWGEMFHLHIWGSNTAEASKLFLNKSLMSQFNVSKSDLKKLYEKFKYECSVSDTECDASVKKYMNTFEDFYKNIAED